jgi:hypothetical protein
MDQPRGDRTTTLNLAPSNRAPRIGVLGYLAVLDRIALPVPRDQVGAGQTGHQLRPTLTSDAPLVALALASLSARAEVPWQVHACLNHPGQTPAAQASIDLLRSSTSELTLAPDCGPPLEWQLIHAGGEITWYSDPTRALASLQGMQALNWRALGWQQVYLDAYPWLAPTLSEHLPVDGPAVWLNLGVVPHASLPGMVSQWREHVSGPLRVQVSTAGRASLREAQAWAQTAIDAGVDLALVSSAQHGLVLADTHGMAAQPALPVPHWVDASGAGASVSSALMAALQTASLRGRAKHDLQALALLAATAGRDQCMRDGALDSDSQRLWQAALQARGV